MSDWQVGKTIHFNSRIKPRDVDKKLHQTLKIGAF